MKRLSKSCFGSQLKSTGIERLLIVILGRTIILANIKKSNT